MTASFQHGLAATIDHRATSAAVSILRKHGTAADAAIAANAVLAVTAQHMCGLGGDLLALVHAGTNEITGLNASGRAGSGADPDTLRAKGHTRMPFRGDPNVVTVPGCVDGWFALHERYGSMELHDLLAPAIQLAEDGFSASPLLASFAAQVQDVDGADDFIQPGGRVVRPGELVRRPAIADALREISKGGRDSWYLGRFGASLLELGDGLFEEQDLATHQANWTEPIRLEVGGHMVWSMPPNSQGYLALAALSIAEQVGLPDSPDDPAWAHVLIEAAKVTGYRRPAELHEHADAAQLLDAKRLRKFAASVSPQASRSPVLDAEGDTTFVATVDEAGRGVSLIQSNAAGFGAHIVAPGTGIFLHNRGVGFNLLAGHAAEYRPRRRPPHTLSPTLLTTPTGDLRAIVGTMGGDRQPQVLVQLLASILWTVQNPAATLAAGRWGLSTGTDEPGFGTWTSRADPVVEIEGQAPAGWFEGLASRGHRIRRRGRLDPDFGQAQVITVDDDGYVGAADPRSTIGAARGW